MAKGSGSRDFALEELIDVVRCQTGGAQEGFAKAW